MNIKVFTSFFLLFLILFIPSCTSQKNNLDTMSAPAVEDNNNIDLDEISKNDRISKDEQMKLLLSNYDSEIEKMQSQIKLLTNEIAQIKAYKEIWSEPLSIYNKKIIMINGSTIFGNIIFQDDTSLKVETLIGTIIIPKSDIIRIVDNYSNMDENVIGEVDILKNNIEEHILNNNYPNSAKIILMGDFIEKQDENYNTLLSGQVKNIGEKRADFIKINFTIYKDKQTQNSSADFTVFISGETREFENNIISNSSLSENSIGAFSVVIPSDFGPFTSYTYTIDWEQYD